MSHIMCLWLDLSFPCVVWLDQYVSMFVHVLVAFLHVLCFMPWLDPSFLCVDVKVTCSHACMMSLAMPCLDLCVLCVNFHAIWLDPCLHMRIMLGFMFFHDYVLSFYTFACMFLCLEVYIYVSACLCAWIYVLYTLYATFHVLMRSMSYLYA